MRERDGATSPPAYSLGAFARVVEDHQQGLYAFLRGMVRNDEQARDLVQDTFHSAWRTAQSGTPPFTPAHSGDDIRRWLYHAAYCRGVSALRRLKLIRWESLDVFGEAGLPAMRTSFEEQIAEGEALRAALARLSPQDAACLLLRVVRGFSAAEVAQIVGASVDVVTKRLSRAKQRLRGPPGWRRRGAARGAGGGADTPMSSNHHLAPRVAEPECGRYAALLPVLDEAGTDPAAAAQARDHAAGCARCQADLAAYARLEDALRRHFGPHAAPRLSTADLLWGSTGLLLEDIMHDAPDTAPTTPPHDATTHDIPDRPAFPPLPNLAAHRPRGPRRLISAVAAIAAVLALAVTAQVLFTGSHSHPTSTTKPHATATTAPVYPPFDQLTSIVTVSPTEAWAAGGGGFFNATQPPYLLHEINGRWQQVPLSCQCPGGIFALSLVSPTDIWAVGEQGLVLHYDGQRWARLPSPTDPTNATGPNFMALDMLSATEGWALDQSDTLWHYQNSGWAQLKAPIIPGMTQPYTLQLHGISMVNANEGWAAGEADPQIVTTNGDSTTSNPGPPTGVILHYTAGHWSVQGTWPNTILHTVVMTSADAGWAGGESDQQVTYGLPNAIPPIPASTGTVVTPLLLRYQHGSWRVAPNPVHSPDYSKGSLTQIVMLSPDEGWALETLSGSFTYNANAASVGNLLLHYHNAMWSEVELPQVYNRDSAPVNAIAVTPQGDLWLAGTAWWPRSTWVTTADGNTAPKATALILHYSQGTWSVVES